MISNLIFSNLLILMLAPTPLWKVETQLSNPESSFYDATSDAIYISNVVGDPSQKDGIGWISKYSSGGKLLEAKWIDGLDAPKGIRIRDGKLWVTNIDQILSYDVTTKKLLSKINISGSKFLNDIDVGPDGSVYVSDTLASRIYKVAGDKPVVFFEGEKAEAPNGLLVKDNDLIVAAWGMPAADWSTKTPGHLYKLNLKTRSKTLITKKPLGNLDGLEVDKAGNFLVSDWMAGKVFTVNSQGKTLQTMEGFKNSADIGIIASQNILLVPSMSESKLLAFSLK